MVHQPLAEHHRFVAGVDAYVDVQAEAHQPTRGVLQELNETQIALGGGHFLVMPARKRMGSGPVESRVEACGYLPGDLELGPEGRRRDPRIGQDRQALIMSGAAILQALLRSWPTDRLSVADRGLREGLLYAQMSADGVLEDGPF